MLMSGQASGFRDQYVPDAKLPETADTKLDASAVGAGMMTGVMGARVIPVGIEADAGKKIDVT